MSMDRIVRGIARGLLVGLRGRAGASAEFHGRWSARPPVPHCHATLETRCRDEIAPRSRSLSRSLARRLDGSERSARSDFRMTTQYAATFMQIDRPVGAALGIDIGSREAALSALAPSYETLARLSARSNAIAVMSTNDERRRVSRRHIDQPQLHPLRAVPAIERTTCRRRARPARGSARAPFPSFCPAARNAMALMVAPSPARSRARMCA